MDVQPAVSPTFYQNAKITVISKIEVRYEKKEFSYFDLRIGDGFLEQ